MDAKKSAIPYTKNPTDQLEVHEADMLRDFLTNECKRLYPDDKKMQGKFMMQGWSKLKAHFKVSYREIPSGQLQEAMSLLARHSASHSNGIDQVYQDALGGYRILIGVNPSEKPTAQLVPEDAGINRSDDWPSMIEQQGGLMKPQEWYRSVTRSGFKRLNPLEQLACVAELTTHITQQVADERMKISWNG